jgi:hypothetical protein
LGDELQNVELKHQGGTGAPYLAARLARDHPDILAKLEAGVFSSVRAAALAAGIVRPTGIIYTDRPADAAKKLRRWFRGERLEMLARCLQTD